MKYFLALTIILYSVFSFSQTKIDETNNIATFCKIWGFLKYHHPTVAKGKYDWDRVFLDKINIVKKLKTKNEINDFYSYWILSLGKLKTHTLISPSSNAILSNYNNDWIKDTRIFSNDVTKLLLQVKNNTKSRNHYVKRKFLGLASASFTNENLYKDSIFPSVEMRLLVLSRYWNIVNYFYPYKYLTDTSWQEILNQFIPEFINVRNIKSYHLQLLSLFAKLNDSHTGFNYRLFAAQYKMVPFDTKIVEDKIVVVDVFNDSLCKSSNIKYGDVILKINGESVQKRIECFSKYISTSNYASLCSQLTPVLIWQHLKFPVTATCERNGRIFKNEVPEYPPALQYRDMQIKKERISDNPQADKLKLFANNIAYIDLRNLKSKKETKNILQRVKHSKAAILDIRNYPNSSIFRPITNFFCSSKKPFAKFAHQSIKYPGALEWVKTVYCGKRRGQRYEGRVVVLTNETTISFAEYFTMALKTIPNVILIGNHTAGADGSNYHFKLPGDITTSFSNEAVYFPNGEETQRVGIVPDIIVIPTIEGIRLRKDEALEKAIEILSRK